MTSEARATGSLDPAMERAPQRRHRRGRRPPDRSSRPRTDRRRGGAVYAALDLGTNNCRLLVARPTDDSFRVVDAFSRIIRLGEGVSQTGRISEAAIERAVVALSVCRDKMRDRGVSRARLIATEACRAAENGEAFRAASPRRSASNWRSSTAKPRRRWRRRAARRWSAPEAEGVVLFDIGGGSSELVLLGPTVRHSGGPASAKIEAWTSLPIGVVTLAERHGGVEVSPEIYEAMVQEVAEHVTPFAEAQGGGEPRPRPYARHLGDRNDDRRRASAAAALRPAAHRWRLAQWPADFRRGRGLLAMDYHDRVANPCIGAERADLVLAGCAILEAIRRAFPCARLRVADRGLREGMLVQMMREDRVWDTPAGAAP